MSSVNKAIIIGNLCADVEIKKTQSGDSVTTLNIATNEKWTDKASGEKKEATEFHRVVLWGKVADVAANYLKKGSKVYFEGQIKTRSWEQDGQKRYTTEIVVQGFNGKMVMLDSKGDNQAPQQQAQDTYADDIPF